TKAHQRYSPSQSPKNRKGCVANGFYEEGRGSRNICCASNLCFACTFVLLRSFWAEPNSSPFAAHSGSSDTTTTTDAGLNSTARSGTHAPPPLWLPRCTGRNTGWEERIFSISGPIV